MNPDNSTTPASRRQTILITGASSGIGAETARLLARPNTTLVLAARRLDRLQALADELSGSGCEVLTRAVDLAEPQAPDELMAWIDEQCGGLRVLINNAGFGRQVSFVDQDEEEIERMFRVNVLSMISLSRLAIPLMKRGGGGSIVNVASVGGHVSHPLNVVYCATKHAVVGFSKSLRLELLGSGVNVVVVCPGGTRTEFFDRASSGIPFALGIEKLLVPPETSARTIERAIHSRRPVLYPSWGAALLVWLDRWLPPLSRWGNVYYRDRALARGD